ncbi:hypothetical protein BCR34DRAFT_4150 [Clohesyomyces aquaticus]|uniref:Uncharacterized protein n=1 Tax=Clohesyomyces aquaticus TaxID=1231657 RepID=A0A1Y2ABZ5_9PLEO|nr:hypothetical protein BCR34DRAFT_4150 [Clohesyomyces aquaticus]
MKCRILHFLRRIASRLKSRWSLEVLTRYPSLGTFLGVVSRPQPCMHGAEQGGFSRTSTPRQHLGQTHRNPDMTVAHASAYTRQFPRVVSILACFSGASSCTHNVCRHINSRLEGNNPGQRREPRITWRIPPGRYGPITARAVPWPRNQWWCLPNNDTH